MPRVDLTPFGFTPTESLVYQVLLTSGPGTGYAIARSAGLARANTYGALEGLVTKGAARVDGLRPKRYRPEPPMALIARISTDQGEALERLSGELDTIALPESPTLVEITSPRGSLQLLAHDIGRASDSVWLLAPADAFPILTPSLRRASAAGLGMILLSPDPVTLPFAKVGTIAPPSDWPGQPLVSVVDGRSGILAFRDGAEVRGHWSTAPAFVAAARHTFERLRALS